MRSATPSASATSTCPPPPSASGAPSATRGRDREDAMNDFKFHRPASVKDAVAALRAAPEGKYLGGGQSLLPVMKLGLATPTDVVTLAGLPDLGGIRVEGKELVVGAGVTHAEVAVSAEVKKAIPALAALAEHIGDAQVRNRGTLGGSL